MSYREHDSRGRDVHYSSKNHYIDRQFHGNRRKKNYYWNKYSPVSHNNQSKSRPNKYWKSPTFQSTKSFNKSNYRLQIPYQLSSKDQNLINFSTDDFENGNFKNFDNAAKSTSAFDQFESFTTPKSVNKKAITTKPSPEINGNKSGGISLVPISLLLKNDLCLENAIEKEAPTSQSETENSSQKVQSLPSHPPPSTPRRTIDPDKVSRRLIAKVATMDKNNIKHVINNPFSKFDAALKVHARKTLREEIRKQLRTMSFETITENDAQFFEPDECVNSENIPDAVFDEIGRALRLSLFNERSKDEDTSICSLNSLQSTNNELEHIENTDNDQDLIRTEVRIFNESCTPPVNNKITKIRPNIDLMTKIKNLEDIKYKCREQLKKQKYSGNKRNSLKDNEIITLSSSSNSSGSSSSSEDESVTSSAKQKHKPTMMKGQTAALDQRVIESFNNIILPKASDDIRNQYEKSINKSLPEALASIYNICRNEIEKQNLRASNVTAIELDQKKNNSFDSGEEEALQFLVENIQELFQEDNNLNADQLSTDRNSSKNEASHNKYKDIYPSSSTSYVGVADTEEEKQTESAIIKTPKPQNVVVRKENYSLDKDRSLDRSWEKEQTNKALNSNQCKEVRGKRSHKFTTKSVDVDYCLEGETSGKKRKQNEKSTIKARKGNQIQSSFHNDNNGSGRKTRASLSNYKNQKNANQSGKFKDKAYPIPDICNRQRTDRSTHNRVSSMKSNPIPPMEEQHHKARGKETVYERINEEVSEGTETAQSAFEGEAFGTEYNMGALEVESCGSKTCHDSLYLETVFNSDKEESEDGCSFEENSILVEGDKNSPIKGKPQELNNDESIRYTLNDNVGYLTTVQRQSLQRGNPIEGSNSCLVENSDVDALANQLNCNEDIERDNHVDCKNRYINNENSIQNKEISSLTSIGSPTISTNGENNNLNTMEQEQKPRVWKSPGEKKCIEPITVSYCSTPTEATEFEDSMQDSIDDNAFQIGNNFPELNQENKIFNDMQQTDTIGMLSLIQQNKISDVVINNLKDIDLKLMELHRRKMYVDEVILKLQKDKMAIDLSTMQLQNERFLVISSVLSNSNNSLRNSAYPPFSPNSNIVSQFGNIENTANILQLLEEMKKSQKSKKPKKKPRIIKKKNTTSSHYINRKKRCQTDILLEETACTLFSNDAVKSKMIRDTSPARLSENADNIFHIDSKRTAKRNVLLQKASSQSQNKKRVCAIVKPVVKNSVSKGISSTGKNSTRNSTLPNTRSSKAKKNNLPRNSKNLKECKILLEKIDSEQYERLSPDSSNSQVDIAPNPGESAIDNTMPTISSSSSIQIDDATSFSEDNFVNSCTVPNGHFLGSKLPITQIKAAGDYIIAASEDGNVYKFHWKTKEMLSSFSKHTEAITGIIVDRNHFVYSISLDGFLRKTSVENFGLEIQFANLQEPLQAIDLEWSTAFIGSRWGNVFTYDVKNNKLFDTLLCSVGSAITALKATKEGPRKILIVSSKGNQINLRDATTGLLLRNLLIPDNINISSVLLDGGLLHFGSNKNEVYTYDFTSGTKVGTQICGNGAVSMQLFRNKCIFVGCYDGFIYVVDKTTSSLIGRFPGSGKMILAMEIVGEKIITSSKDNFLEMMDIPKYILALVNRK